MEQKTLVLEDKREISYCEWIHGPGDSVPLILIHGYLDSCRTWEQIMKFVSYPRVIAVTLPGWGDSSKEGIGGLRNAS